MCTHSLFDILPLINVGAEELFPHLTSNMSRPAEGAINSSKWNTLGSTQPSPSLFNQSDMAYPMLLEVSFKVISIPS